MADFKTGGVAPQNSETTLRPPHEQGSIGGPDSCPVCEAPKLGSESIANFSEGPGVPPSRTKIH